MAFMSSFEQATGIDVPDQICGIDIPDADIGDLADFAQDVLSTVGDLGDMVEKATRIREVLCKATRSAGNCFGVIDRAQDILSGIANNMEPLMPLFQQSPMALSLFTKENLDTCCKIILDVFDLSKLLQKIMALLDGVKQIFMTISEVCGDVVDTVMEFLSDVAQAFAQALHLEDAMEGLQDLFEGITSLIAELGDIEGCLRPVLEAWQDANFLEAGVFAVQNFDEVKESLCDRFLPSWETCQQHYGTSRDFGSRGFEQAKVAWGAFGPMFKKLCVLAGVAVPVGLAMADAMPTVSGRGDIEMTPEFQNDNSNSDHQAPSYGGDGGNGSGGDSEDNSEMGQLRALFHRCKDTHHGFSHDRFRDLLSSLDGLDEDEVNEIVEQYDADGNGIIDVDEFLQWIWGDRVCDEDRQRLKEM